MCSQLTTLRTPTLFSWTMTVQETQRKKKKRTISTAHQFDQKLATSILRDHKVEKAFSCKISWILHNPAGNNKAPTAFCQREASNFRVGTDPFTQWENFPHVQSAPQQFVASQNAIYSSCSGRKIRGQSDYYSNCKAEGCIGHTGLFYFSCQQGTVQLGFQL